MFFGRYRKNVYQCAYFFITVNRRHRGSVYIPGVSKTVPWQIRSLGDYILDNTKRLYQIFFKVNIPLNFKKIMASMNRLAVTCSSSVFGELYLMVAFIIECTRGSIIARNLA